MRSNLEVPPRKKASKPTCGRANRKQKTGLLSYQPTDWLSSIMPRKLPFYPQMGDEVMYFRKGHEMYLAAVEHKNLYEINPSSLPWTKMIIRQQEWVKIIGIDYEIKPPMRLVCLKLGIIDANTGVLTQQCFSVEYHDLDIVTDFIVLKQDYDVAIKRTWKPLQKFRCLMNDQSGVQMWWEGQFIKRLPLDSEFPESMFLCYCIKWDDGERDRLSPWDLENIDPGRRPFETGTGVQLLPIEIYSALYSPKTDDWPPLGDRNGECDRISAGISQVMGLYVAKHFSTPVNLELFPNYASIVKYPVDLSTIIARLDNRFYRRTTAVEYDVRRIRINALIFNDPKKSDIVKNSYIVTDLCLEIIRNSEVDITAFYLHLEEKYEVHGIKVKGSLKKQPIEKHQTKQSSSFALTFADVVTGSSKTSASVQTSISKLVFNPSQESAPLVSSNISVKVSSSLTVDEPLADVDLTTDSHKPIESLCHNSYNSETSNTSRMRKKVTSLVGIEVEQPPKRRKTTSINNPVAGYSDNQFSDANIQGSDEFVTNYPNQNALLTRNSVLKRKSKTKENIDTTCCTTSSPSGKDDAQAIVAVKSVTHSQNYCSSMGVGQNDIFSLRATNKHLNLTGIRIKEMGAPLIKHIKSPALFSPLHTPTPIAVSTPVQVRQRKSSLFRNNSPREMVKYASGSPLPTNQLITQKKRNNKKLNLSGWNISFHDRSEGLNYHVSQDKSPRSSLSKEDLMIETADLEACNQSTQQYSKVKTTSSLSFTQKTSTYNGATTMTVSYPTVSSLTDLDTKSVRKKSPIRVEYPTAADSTPNSVLPEERESSQSIAELIEQILAENKSDVLKEKTSKKEKSKATAIPHCLTDSLSAHPHLSKENMNCKEFVKLKSKFRKNYTQEEVTPVSSAILLDNTKKSLNKEVTLTPADLVKMDLCKINRLSSTIKEMPTKKHRRNVTTNKTSFKEKGKSKSFEAIGSNQQSVYPEERESSESRSALIKQILAESQRDFLKQKSDANRVEKNKKIESSSIPDLLMVDKCCQKSSEAKMKNSQISPASVTIPFEKDRKKLPNKKIASISRNVDNKKGRLSAIPNEKLSAKVNVLSNKSNFTGKKEELCKLTCANQHSVFSEEINESDDTIIQQTVAERDRSFLKHKINKRKTLVFSSSLKNKDCQIPQKVLKPEVSSLENPLYRSRCSSQMQNDNFS